MTDRLAAKSVEGMEMRLKQMSSSQRERLAAENAEEREVRLQHDRESHRERRVQETLGGQVASPTYSTACCTSQDAMHKWLHWRCPLLTESFACHSSPGMTLVLGTLIPFVISFFFHMSMYGHLAISDHNLRSCHCMHVYCPSSLRLAPQCPAFA